MTGNSDIHAGMDSVEHTKHKRHDERFSQVDGRILDIGDDLTEYGRAISSHDTAIGTLVSEVNNIINRPSKMPIVMSIVGVAITVMALALTPVAWLAVRNAEKLDLARFAGAKNTANIEALYKITENNDHHLHEALKDQNDRIKYMERLQMAKNQ